MQLCKTSFRRRTWQLINPKFGGAFSASGGGVKQLERVNDGWFAGEAMLGAWGQALLQATIGEPLAYWAVSTFREIGMMPVSFR